MRKTLFEQPIYIAVTTTAFLALSFTGLLHPATADALPINTITTNQEASTAIRESAWGQTALGCQLLNKGQYEKALPYLSKATAKDPKHLIAYYLTATTADDLSHRKAGALSAADTQHYTDIAKAAFEKTVLLNPKILSATLRLGKMAMSSNNYDEAAGYYKKALNVLPNNAMLHFNLANAYDEAGKSALAIHHYEQTIALDGKFTYAYNNLGLLYESQGKNDHALKAFEQALAVNPKYTYARLNLGQLLIKTDQFNEAEDAFLTALNHDNTNNWAYLYLGNLYAQQAKYPAAEEAYRLSIKHEPNFAAAYYLLAAVLEKQDNWQESQTYANVYLSMAPDGQFSSNAHQIVAYTKQQQQLKLAESAQPSPIANIPTRAKSSEETHDVLHGYVSAP